MADIRQVTDIFAVAPQISEDDFTEIAAKGFKLVVCNRPDGEAPDQMTSAAAAAAAEAAGLEYKYIPFSKMPTEDAVDAFRDVLNSSESPVFAYCRSGTRSTVVWCMASVLLDRETPQSALQKAAGAGYDLQQIEPILSSL